MNESDGNIRIMEELMQEIHRLALEKEVSVSDIVHEALSEFLYVREAGISCFDVIHSIEESMNRAEHFIVNANLFDFAVNIKSPLQYVYRPAIKYEIKITQNNAPHIGKINIVLRSHEINTLKSFSDFINLWIALENKYTPHTLAEPMQYSVDVGYFGRKIHLPPTTGHITGRVVGSAIGEYIHAFDGLFKHYFFHPESGSREIEYIYANHIKEGKLNV